MSSESRTSGDGEAKEMEQDQNDEPAERLGPSTVDTSLSDMETNAEKDITRGTETGESLETDDSAGAETSNVQGTTLRNEDTKVTLVGGKEDPGLKQVVTNSEDGPEKQDTSNTSKPNESVVESIAGDSGNKYVDRSKDTNDLVKDQDQKEDVSNTREDDSSTVSADRTKPQSGDSLDSAGDKDRTASVHKLHPQEVGDLTGSDEPTSGTVVDVDSTTAEPRPQKTGSMTTDGEKESSTEDTVVEDDDHSETPLPSSDKPPEQLSQTLPEGSNQDVQTDKEKVTTAQQPNGGDGNSMADVIEPEVETEAGKHDRGVVDGPEEQQDVKEPEAEDKTVDDTTPNEQLQQTKEKHVSEDEKERPVREQDEKKDASSTREGEKVSLGDYNSTKEEGSVSTVTERDVSSANEKKSDISVAAKEDPPVEPSGGTQTKEPSVMRVEENQEDEDSSGGPTEARVLSEDFFYDYDKLCSKPESLDLPLNMLELHHSFGFECQKRSNLVVLDKDVVAFAAGNFVNMVHVCTGGHTYLRSLSGGGIGALAVHPSYKYFAVGEKGSYPNIAIYTFPGLKLHRLLREGTEEMYSHMDFSPNDGALLASVGGNPDYMLTVWDWKKESIVLRSKAFSQDIYRVSFSPDLEGQLTTSGTGHIRFWKMARTFTGLKLQGQLGKFGRTELSDIAAYVELPDGKVLSGTEWGNLLLWDGGFIKVEIAKKGKKTCHHGAIEAMFLEEGELITAGADGYVKVWDYETIDNADITEDNTQFEMEPLTEIRVGTKVSIKSLVRSMDPDMSTMWYAQDASGAIWKVDIIDSHTRKPPEKLLQFPSGAIKGLGVSSKEHLAAVIAEDGGITVFNYVSKERVCTSKFTGGGGTLLWAPAQIDAGSRTLITGFGDGVVRVLVMEDSDPRQVSAGRRLSPKLVLGHVCKPHSKTVTALAVDPSGELLATGGKDSTVFFLSVKEAYDPIGFIQPPSPVTSLMWSHHDNLDELKLLVCCDDGSMMEVDAPKKGVFDTSQTYYLDPLKFTCKTFQTVKDKIRKAEEEARVAAEKEKKRKEREERLQKKREEEGEDAELSDEEEEEEPEPEEVQEDEEKQKGPSPILKGFYYGPEREFWLSMGGYDAGFLYQCSLTDTEPGGPVVPYEPKTSLPLPTIAGRDMPLTAITTSNSGQYMLVGSENGAVRIFPLVEGDSSEHHIEDFSSYWTFNVHDNHYGHVTHICCSHDDKYVLTAGNDGNIFVFKACLEAKPKKKELLHHGDIKSVLDLTSEVKDIEDPNAYSIEDAKQKAEHDRRMKAAEEKKQSVRHEILALRKQFQQLMNKADKLPEHLRLPKDEFVMDPDMEATLKVQLQEKINTVHREMAWEAEKCILLKKKLENRFKAVVQTEHIVVKAIGSEASVSSYRTPVPSKEYIAMMKEYQEQVSSRPTTADTYSTRPTTTAVGMKDVDDTLKQEAPVGVPSYQKHASKAVEKAEARRIRRIARQKQWAELRESKPDEKYEDPSDLAAFRHAERTIGDYKLKSGSDYVVPEDQRVTATKKRHELLVLRNEILTRKSNFNAYLLALRDRKKQLLEKIKELTASLEEVQGQLPPDMRKEVPPVPTMDQEELPELAYEFSKESLLTFKEELAARKEAESKAKSGGGDDFGGFGGFGGGGGGGGDTQPPEGGDTKGEEKPPEVEEGVPEEEQPQEEHSEQDGQEEDEEQTPKSEEGSLTSVEETEVEILSPVEKKLKEEQLIRCICERDWLLGEITKLKDDFDRDLLWLRHEKSLQDIQMKMADLRHINLFEELELLKEFEKRESTYTTRYTSKKKERKELETKIEQCKQQLQIKEAELSRLHEEEKALEASFLEEVGENKFREFLVKVFKKKIKRAKKEEEGTDGGDDESDEDDSDSEWMSSSDEEDEEGEGKLDDAVCPEGCEETLFDLACQLREKRMDFEEGIAEGKKQLELAKKEVESLKKKYKVLESGVKSAYSELQAFQLEKQQKLNELDQVVVLKFSQIMYYGRGATPPTNLASCLVFSASERHRLRNRISELHLEKQQEARNFSEIKQRHVKLSRDKKMMLSKVQELQDKVDNAMMLKFGRLVDLDKLEDIHVNKVAEELRMKIEAVERKTAKFLAESDEKLEREKTHYLEVLRDNTRRLSKVSELQKAQKNLERKLNARQKTMAAPYNGEFFDDIERERLMGLVDFQVQEIDMLKDDIRMLQHKGGHVLPPAQPPMAASSHHQ